MMTGPPPEYLERWIRRPRKEHRAAVRGRLAVQYLNQGGPGRGRIISRKAETIVGA